MLDRYNPITTCSTPSPEIFVETEASKMHIKHEYDPLKPNDYSIVQALQQKRKREKKYEEDVS